MAIKPKAKISRAQQARQKANSKISLAKSSTDVINANQQVYDAKTAAKMAKINEASAIKVAKQNAQQAENQAKAANRIAREESWRHGNFIQKHIQGKRDLKTKKRQYKIDKMDIDLETRKLDPELKRIEAQSNAEVKKTRAAATAKFGGYSAIGTGAATLGRGLIDEQNRDDKKRYDSLQDSLSKIFGNDSDNNSSDSTTTGADLNEAVT